MADMIEKQVLSSTVPVWPWAVISRIMYLIPERLWCRINVWVIQSCSKKHHLF